MLEQLFALLVALADEDEVDGVVVDDFGDVAVYFLYLFVILLYCGGCLCNLRADVIELF